MCIYIYIYIHIHTHYSICICMYVCIYIYRERERERERQRERERERYILSVGFPSGIPFRGSSVGVGTVQRRFARPPRKGDARKPRSENRVGLGSIDSISTWFGISVSTLLRSSGPKTHAGPSLLSHKRLGFDTNSPFGDWSPAW